VNSREELTGHEVQRSWWLGKGIWECFYSTGKAEFRMINLSLRDNTEI